MKQVIRGGQEIDTVTPEEVKALLPSINGTSRQVSRVRATATVQLSATGSGLLAVYTVPVGFEFAVRRVWIALATVGLDPFVSAIHLGAAANQYVLYQRSGTVIETGQPTGPPPAAGGPVCQVPGVQTWGDQQGPYLRNGETFEINAFLGGNAAANNAILEATVEGLLNKPAK